MDELQFRRSIYADPKSQDEEILAAQQNDPAKKQFAKELAQLDDKIASALNVPVPEDLSNKLILRQTLASHQMHKRKKRIHLALAASVAIIAGLLINFVQFSSAYSNLGDHALAHVYHEQGYFSNNDKERVSLTSLNEKMADFNGSFSEQVGELLFADFCRFDGMRSLHLVFQGKTSPVTVFVVPKNDELAFSSKFNDTQLFGESLKFDNANVIVIGDKNEQLSTWQSTLNNTLSWSI